MNVEGQINEYISSLTEQKALEMRDLHLRILGFMPNCNLWYLNGKDEKGKTVSNPQIGYGHQTLTYADGKTKPFYQIGISANTSGISVYIIGIEDKKYLPETYGKMIGKASVTSYCIKFKSLKDIKLDALELAIRDGIEISGRICKINN